MQPMPKAGTQQLPQPLLTQKVFILMLLVPVPMLKDFILMLQVITLTQKDITHQLLDLDHMLKVF